jgi:hypothetical protein
MAELPGPRRRPSRQNGPVIRPMLRTGTLALLLALTAVGCGQGPTTPADAIATVEPGGPVIPLELEVQNSGLPGGYLWLGITDQAASGRWHRFGDAELLCVTCPVPLPGVAASYDIAIFDETCVLRSARRTPGGHLRWEIGLGPTFTLAPAPVGGDWIPGDSAAAAPGRVPCTPP